MKHIELNFPHVSLPWSRYGSWHRQGVTMVSCGTNCTPPVWVWPSIINEGRILTIIFTTFPQSMPALFSTIFSKCKRYDLKPSNITLSYRVWCLHPFIAMTPINGGHIWVTELQVEFSFSISVALKLVQNGEKVSSWITGVPPYSSIWSREESTSCVVAEYLQERNIWIISLCKPLLLQVGAGLVQEVVGEGEHAHQRHHRHGGHDQGGLLWHRESGDQLHCHLSHCLLMATDCSFEINW